MSVAASAATFQRWWPSSGDLQLQSRFTSVGDDDGSRLKATHSIPGVHQILLITLGIPVERAAHCADARASSGMTQMMLVTRCSRTSIWVRLTVYKNESGHPSRTEAADMLTKKVSVALAAIVLSLLSPESSGARARLSLAAAQVQCQNKLMTSYSRRMLDAMRPASAFEGSLHLQQRFIAGVHLYAGVIQGMQRIQPIEEPTRLFCYNNSVAALQTVSESGSSCQALTRSLSRGRTEVQNRRRRRCLRLRLRCDGRGEGQAAPSTTRLLY